MRYRPAIFVGLIATIVYFDVTKDYNEQIWQQCENLMVWRSKESILADRYGRFVDKTQTLASSFFIGFNGNMDVILNGKELLKKLGYSSSDSIHGQDKLVINTAADLASVFTHYFNQETAAERAVIEEDSWLEILKAINEIEDKTYFIGGNAALIARTMSYSKIAIKLAVPGGPELIKQLKEYKVDVMDQCQQSQDELHVIMEYGVGEEFAGHTSKRANRFIFSRDIANSQMSAIACLTEEAVANVDVVVIAGFHMLETQPTVQQHAVIKSVRERLLSHKQIHLELASMTNRAFLLDLFNMLAVHSHSLGLNEAELDFLSVSLGGDRVDVQDISSVKAALVLVLEKAGRESLLTRVHFHCLTYHVIIERKDHWKNSAVSVAMGTYIAAKFACDTPTIVPTNHELRYLGTDIKPVQSEEIGEYMLHISPVLVCKQPLKTVGLGDSISATGLLYTIRTDN